MTRYLLEDGKTARCWWRHSGRGVGRDVRHAVCGSCCRSLEDVVEATSEAFDSCSHQMSRFILEGAQAAESMSSTLTDFPAPERRPFIPCRPPSIDRPSSSPANAVNGCEHLEEIRQYKPRSKLEEVLTSALTNLVSTVHSSQMLFLLFTVRNKHRWILLAPCKIATAGGHSHRKRGDFGRASTREKAARSGCAHMEPQLSLMFLKSAARLIQRNGR
ncbi:hypothetical protein SCHPADRAFT_897132 [Schizopora paradoxa]|uniref:Uncharacterized protein n=1 Tax=Schizopora paradoxa TaxID=27342 RepID=A0A0H2QZA9_9AGAM|nr:hypothetical protein SCHPADRAFT_897132 [Schizopora paradoxa]